MGVFRRLSWILGCSAVSTLPRKMAVWEFFLSVRLLFRVDFGAAFACGHVAGSFDPACGTVEIR